MKRRTGSVFDTRWLALLFAITAAVTGWRLTMLTPIGQVADEPAHIARAGALLHGELLGHRVPYRESRRNVTPTVPVTRVNLGLLEASNHERNASCAASQSVATAKAIRWNKRRGNDITFNTIQYFPAFYLPGSVGISLGHAFGQRPLAALFTGRLFMLLDYILLGTCAILLARFGRPLLFALLSLPMALSLGASFNQDGQLIAATALAAALLTADPTWHPRRRWFAAVLLLLVIGSKPPYGLLLFAAALPLAAAGSARRIILLAVSGVLPLIWVIVMLKTSFVPYLRSAYHPGPLWPGDPSTLFHTTDAAQNLRVLLVHPARIVTLPVRSIMDNLRFLAASSVGILGWLTITLSHSMYFAWGFALMSALVGTMFAASPDSLSWDLADAALVLCLVVLSVLAIELAIYLSWDKVGSASITGSQGRYFLPFVPFLILILPRSTGPRSALPRRAFAEAATALPAIGLAIYDIAYLPGLMLKRFCLG